MEINLIKQRSAKRWSILSFLIGIGVVPVGFGLAWILSYTRFDSSLLFFITLLIASLAGLVIGVVALVKSIRKQSRTTKGIVFSSLGILLNLSVICGTLLVWVISDAVSRPLI